MTNIKKANKKGSVDQATRDITVGRIKLILFTIGLYIVLNIITSGRILTYDNLSLVFTSAVTNIFIAWCLCFVFTPGITDLSIGAILVLASNVGGIFAVNLNLGTFGLLLGSILTSVILLLVNTTLRKLTKVPSWIFGIAIMMVYEAIGMFYSSYKVSNGKQVVSLGGVAREIGRAPWNFVLVIAGLIAAYLLLNKTSIGYNIRALGSNQKVSEMMGVNVGKTLIQSAVVGGIFLGIGAAVHLSYSNRVNPVSGLSSIHFLITALAGFLLASTLTKYVNLTVAIVIAVFIISSLFNVLTILGVPSGTWQETVMGLTVIISGIVSQRKSKGVVK